MKKLFIFILTSLIAFQAMASQNALSVLEKVEAVLAPKSDAITLEQAKEMAAGENIDIKLAYESLFQAQRKIGQARAAYFPYGLGDSLLIYYTNAFSALILVELATSLPSKWYNVQNQKHLRNAEAYNLKALRENIKNQVAQMYYGILKEESLQKLVAYELSLMEELVTSREAQVAIGQVDATTVEDLKWRSLKLRDEYLKFESYLAEEKAAYKKLLNLPAMTEVKLQPVSDFLSQNDFTVNVESLALMAENRSFEVKSAQAMINAAYDSRASTKWSILSFGGIGFGYLAKVRVESSKVRQTVLRKDTVEETVYNNTYTREKMFRNSVDFFLSEKNIADTTKSFMMTNIADFKAGNIAVSELIESELYYLRDYREMLMAHYNALSRLDDLERVVLGKVNETEYKTDSFDISMIKGVRKSTLSLDSSIDMNEIKSVTYNLEGKYGRAIKTFNAQTNYSITLKNKYLPEVVKGSALIIFDNGEVIKKNFKL